MRRGKPRAYVNVEVSVNEAPAGSINFPASARARLMRRDCRQSVRLTEIGVAAWRGVAVARPDWP